MRSWGQAWALGSAASPRQALADLTKDGWKQRQLRQGLNKLFLSLCKYCTSKGQGWLLQTPLGLERQQGRSWAGGEGRTLQARAAPRGCSEGADRSWHLTDQPLQPTQHSTNLQRCSSPPSSSSSPRHQPFPSHWIARF